MDPEMQPLRIEDKWGCAFVLALSVAAWVVIAAIVYRVIRWLV